MSHFIKPGTPRLFAKSSVKHTVSPFKTELTLYLHDPCYEASQQAKVTQTYLKLIGAEPLTVSLVLSTIDGCLVMTQPGAVHLPLLQVVQELKAQPCRQVQDLQCFEVSQKTFEYLLWKTLRVSLSTEQSLPVELRTMLSEQAVWVTLSPSYPCKVLQASLVCVVDSGFLQPCEDKLVSYGFSDVLDLRSLLQSLEEQIIQTPLLEFHSVVDELAQGFETLYPTYAAQAQNVAAYLWDLTLHRVGHHLALEV